MYLVKCSCPQVERDFASVVTMQDEHVVCVCVCVVCVCVWCACAYMYVSAVCVVIIMKLNKLLSFLSTEIKGMILAKLDELSLSNNTVCR